MMEESILFYSTQTLNLVRAQLKAVHFRSSGPAFLPCKLCCPTMFLGFINTGGIREVSLFLIKKTKAQILKGAISGNSCSWCKAHLSHFHSLPPYLSPLLSLPLFSVAQLRLCNIPTAASIRKLISEREDSTP